MTNITHISGICIQKTTTLRQCVDTGFEVRYSIWPVKKFHVSYLQETSGYPA